eukprot:1193889-Prorocentrum_minimum.AAC.1
MVTTCVLATNRASSCTCQLPLRAERVDILHVARPHTLRGATGYPHIGTRDTNGLVHNVEAVVVKSASDVASLDEVVEHRTRVYDCGHSTEGLDVDLV